jgi:hypothetical protein
VRIGLISPDKTRHIYFEAMKTHTISVYYGKPPIEVVIPDDWEHDEPDWFRKPMNEEYYVSRLGLVAKFTGSTYQEHPERILVREVKAPK